MSVKSKISYEVNIVVPKSLQAAFIKWLDEHISEMEELDGILEKETKVFENIYFEDQEKLSLSVHYQFDSEESLEQYLQNDADKMRGKLPEEWRNQLNFTRRFLKKLELDV